MSPVRNAFVSSSKLTSRSQVCLNSLVALRNSDIVLPIVFAICGSFRGPRNISATTQIRISSDVPMDSNINKNNLPLPPIVISYQLYAIRYSEVVPVSIAITQLTWISLSPFSVTRPITFASGTSVKKDAALSSSMLISSPPAVCGSNNALCISPETPLSNFTVSPT